MTSRFEALLAEAIRAMGARLHGLQMSPSEALLLAKGGSLRLVHERLRSRLQVRRATPIASGNDEAFQRRLAIAEISADISGVFGEAGRAELITRAIERETGLRLQEATEAGRVRDVGEILRQLEQHGPTFRAFSREVYRLYSDQRRAIEESLSNKFQRDKAMKELDEAYRRHLAHAAQFATPRV